MPEREGLSGKDPCELAERWGVDPDVMTRLVISAEQFEAETAQAVQIISGYRTAAEQKALGRSGRPTAPDELSTHRSCPATGVDVNLGTLPIVVQKHIWGRILMLNGLRWGGGSDLDDDLIPSDWQHLDRGPRAA